MDHATDIARVDSHVQQVADLLPFAAEAEADMGGTFTLQIDLGERANGGYDRAAIETTDQWMEAGQDGEPVWWFEADDGQVHFEQSTFTIDTDPQQVADWIASLAQQHGSPVASN